MALLKTFGENTNQLKPNYKERGADNAGWNKLGGSVYGCVSLDKGSGNELRFKELSKPARMVLASSSKLFLEGIRRILEGEGSINVVAEASGLKEVEKHLTDAKPSLLFLDNRALKLDIDGLLSFIARKSPDTKVILFENQAEDKLTRSNVTHIAKETDSLDLIEVITGLSGGYKTQASSKTPHITGMEIKIIGLIKGGLSNGEIANRLMISEKTVKAHISNLFMKLNLESRYQLIVYAKRLKRKIV